MLKPRHVRMKNFSLSLLIVLILGVFLIAAGCTQNQQDLTSQAPITTPVTTAAPTLGSTMVSTPVSAETLQKGSQISNETLVAFVDSALAYVKTNGREKALAEFSNPNGSFVKGELYIYAYDFNGTTLAHPVSPEKIGVNRMNETDANVGIFLTEVRNVAQQNGKGFVRFSYINPAHNNTLEAKLAYVEKVDDDWYLGSGIYIGPANNS